MSIGYLLVYAGSMSTHKTLATIDWTASEIERLRRMLRLTQLGFANRLGVRQAAVSRWEKGTAYPHPRHLKALDAVADEEGYEPQAQ